MFEELTELIEGGLSGVMCMIFIAFYVLNSLRKCDTEKEPTAIICALPIVSYYLNGMMLPPDYQKDFGGLVYAEKMTGWNYLAPLKTKTAWTNSKEDK